MSVSLILIKRNIKLFFKDKGMFFTSLITPAILLVLYATFLGNLYRDNFTSALNGTVQLSEDLIDGLVGGQLISSILAVSCITVAFCSNFLMVQDKVNGTIKDLRISPAKPATLSLSYYIATLVSTLIICFTATVICLVYVGIVGWYMSVFDVLLLFLDVLLLVLFGTALSSLINFFLSTQGQISALGAILSSQRRLRIYLRRIYAYFLLRRWTAKSSCFSTRHIRHIAGSQPFNAGSLCRYGESGRSRGSD